MYVSMYIPRYLGSRNVIQVLEFLVTVKTFRSKGLSQVRNGGYMKKAILANSVVRVF